MSEIVAELQARITRLEKELSCMELRARSAEHLAEMFRNERDANMVVSNLSNSISNALEGAISRLFPTYIYYDYLNRTFANAIVQAVENGVARAMKK